VTVTRAIVEDSSLPSLPRHVKMRFDQRRNRWIVLAPERVLMPDEVAVEILKLCDGATSVSAIVEGLAKTYDASAEEIGGDVAEMLQDMADKGFVQL
jgi:pyrroloquinoline quinone biosynthesis protein D